MKVLTAVFMTVVFVWMCASCAFAGSANTALQFDGINDFVSVPDSDALSPQIFTGQMTVSMWVKIEAGNSGVALAKGSSWTSWEYSIGVGTGVGFGLWTPGGTTYASAGGGSLTPNEWHNITGTYKKGTFLKVYLDGVLVGQTTALSMSPPIAQGAGNLCFGKEDHSSHPWNFKGAIDEVQIWNYAKTDAEVQQSFDMPLAGNEPGLVAYWSFNEGAGQMVKDVTGHDGILGSSSNPDSADPLWVTANGTPHWNTAPIAHAGQDQRVYAGLDGTAAVTLDGSDSNDPENDALTYTWSYTIDGQVYEANGVKPSLTLSAGAHTITLVVNDGEFNSACDDVNVTVIGPLKVDMKLSPVFHWQPFKLLTADFRFPQHLDEQIDPYSIAFAADPNVKANYFDLNVYHDSITHCNAGFAQVPTPLVKPDTMIKIFGSFRSGRLFYGEDTIKIVRSR